MLSNIMILATRSKTVELADKVMKILAKEDSYIGEPHIEALCSYMDLCIVNNDFKNAIVSFLVPVLIFHFNFFSDVFKLLQNYRQGWSSNNGEGSSFPFDLNWRRSSDNFSTRYWHVGI